MKSIFRNVEKMILYRSVFVTVHAETIPRGVSVHFARESRVLRREIAYNAIFVHREARLLGTE